MPVTELIRKIEKGRRGGHFLDAFVVAPQRDGQGSCFSPEFCDNSHLGDKMGCGDEECSDACGVLVASCHPIAGGGR
jgi:hypothetical protein